MKKSGKALLALILSAALLTGTAFSVVAGATNPEEDDASVSMEADNIIDAEASEGVDFSEADAVEEEPVETSCAADNGTEPATESEASDAILSGEVTPADEVVSNEAAAAFESDAPHEGYLIRFNEDGLAFLAGDSPLSGLFSSLAQLAADSLQTVWGNIYRADDESLITQLVNLGLLTHVEPNYVIELMEEDTTEAADPWPYTLVGADYSARYALTGEGVRIGVIDSGVDLTNVNLQGANIAEGYDYPNSTSEMTDSVYHGTEVIQMIAGTGTDGAMKGVAPGAEIVPLRAFDTSKGNTGMLLQALYDAVDVYHCDIINMSWGMGSDSTLLHDAVEYAVEQGAVLVASSGNVSSSTPQGTLVYPAAYDEVIGIGNVDQQMVVSSKSMQTEAVMFTAPGSYLPFLDASGSLITNSGTSFAAPCAAGLIADLMQALPQEDYTRMLDLMETRAIDLGTAGYDTSYGYGLINLRDILSQPMTWTDSAASGTTISGYWCGDNGGRILVADYLSDGKMQEGKTAMCDSYGFCSYSISLSLPEDCTRLCLFTLTGNGAIGAPMVSLPVNH